MMKRGLIFLVLLILIKFVHAQQSKEAQRHYDKMMGLISSAIGNDTLLVYAIADMNYRQADSIREKILTQIQQSKNEVDQLMLSEKDFTEFKNSTRDLIFFYGVVYQTDYQRMIEIISHSTFGILPEKELLEFNEILAGIDRREKIVLQQFEESRKAFIEKYKIQIP